MRCGTARTPCPRGPSAAGRESSPLSTPVTQAAPAAPASPVYKYNKAPSPAPAPALHTKLNMEIRGLIARNHELQRDKQLSEGWELRWSLPYKTEWVKQYGDKIIATAPAGKRKTRSGNHRTRDIREWTTRTNQTLEENRDP